jgi:magnesium transporter
MAQETIKKPDSNEGLHQLFSAGKMQELAEILSDMPTVEVAEFLADFDDESTLRMLRSLSPGNQGFVFSSFDLDHQLQLVNQFKPRELAILLTHIQSDDRADLFQQMETEDQDRILPFFEKSVRENILHLSSYPEDSAGGSMSSEFASVSNLMTVDQAMAKVRKDAPSKETIYYIYVVDEDQHLMGYLSLKGLILADPKETIENIYHEDVVSVNVNDDQETVAHKVQKYDLIAIPVVNSDGQLLGIITHDDAMDIMREEDTEDVQKIGGMEALDEPYMNISILDMVKKRAGWLVFLLLGGSLTATAMSYFQDEISALVILSLFIPLIIASGGNSGSQASTLVIRALALNEITIGDWWSIVKREFLTGIILGILLGIIGFIRVYFWALGDPVSSTYWMLVGFTVAFSLAGVVLWGALAGSLLPLFLKKLGLDPAVSSAPFISTLVDVTGLIIYFSIAIHLLKGALT